MLRRSSLKRTTSLKPGDGLKPDPEKVREFQARGRRNTNRRPPMLPGVREKAMRRSNYRCIVCGVAEWETGRLHPHHVFVVEHWPELLDEPDNVVALCPTHHAAHHAAQPRVPLVKLPACALRLAEGHPDRQAYLARTYPTVDNRKGGGAL